MKTLTISSEQHYQEIVEKIELIKNAEPGTTQAALLKLFIQAVVAYEREIKDNKIPTSI